MRYALDKPDIAFLLLSFDGTSLGDKEETYW
jgi:hypothetical protein